MTEDTKEIKNLWRIISTGPSSILELRAICPLRKKPPVIRHFRVKDYPSVDACRDAFEVGALCLNADGYNCYVVMNPIRHDFQGKAVTDADITYRDLLLIDIDRAVTAEAPANDAEVDVARELADKIRDHLGTRGFSEPIRTMSGNGHHLYYILSNIPNDDAATQAIEEFLKKLAATYNNGTVKIDTTVYNASRITKVIGTIARKGLATEDRPYRMARLYE